MSKVERNQRVAGEDPVKALSRRIEHGPVGEGREIVNSTHFSDLVNAISGRIRGVKTDDNGIVRIALHGDVLWQPNVLPLRSSRYEPDRAKLQLIARSAALTAAAQSSFKEQDLAGYVDFRELETEADLALNPHPWYQRGKESVYSLQPISLREALKADPQKLIKKAEGEKFKYKLAPSASVLAATATACALTAEPPPAVTVTVEAPSRPTAEVTKTPTPPPTQEVYSGTTDTSVFAVAGVPEGFGGPGEMIEVRNTLDKQERINEQGYAPVVDASGNLAYKQSEDGASVCIMPLPERLYNPDVASGEDLRVGGGSGVVDYGDTSEVRTKVAGAISMSGFPEEWTCTMGVVTDEDNPAGLGALRILVIDQEGNIKAEMKAAYEGESEVELRWGEGGPRLYVNGEIIPFEIKEPIPVTPTPEIKMITFVTTDGQEVTMPEFSGENAVNEALKYISEHALWQTGDMAQKMKALDWLSSSDNPKAVELASKVKKIPGFQPALGCFGPFGSERFIALMAHRLGEGTLIWFEDENGDLLLMYVDNAGPSAFCPMPDTIQTPQP